MTDTEAGGARVHRAEVTGEPISLAEHEELVGHDSAGAVVGFGGIVRDHDHGRGVSALEYSAHPDAAAVIARIASEIGAGATGVRALAVSHRIGRLEVGDAALVCAVAADHRAAAFETCSMLVEAVKAQLPVWKHQLFADGGDEWVGSA